MGEQEHPNPESPFATPEGAEEPIEAAKAEGERAFAHDRDGVVAEPEPGKRYKRIALSEGKIAILLTVNDERGGRVARFTNNEYIEVDGHGVPVNAALAEYYKDGKLPELVDIEPTSEKDEKGA